MNNLPVIAVTLGDVAGIGPETVVRARTDSEISQACRMLAVGSPRVLERALELTGDRMEIVEIPGPKSFSPAEFSSSRLICWNPYGEIADDVAPGRVDARAGEAAYSALVAATRAALDGKVDAVVTAPLNKAALHLAGHRSPGHTEILASECGVDQFAMMLYLPPTDNRWGLGVAHATLHTSLKSVFSLLTEERIVETIALIDTFMKRVGCALPRIGVCALNPHAGEEGLFGDEEATIIDPAVKTSQRGGINVVGPLPADTLLKRAVAGEFDGVCAMYHDQGHIALKLVAFDRAVNVTLGLPIIRTSPSHGTAFDIAWQGKATGSGMIAALKTAAKLVAAKRD